MDSKLEEKAKKKLKEGWIRSIMSIEVLAVTEEAAKKALEKHVEKMEREDKTLIVKKHFHDVMKVEKPLPNVPVAYSYVVELDVLTENFDKAAYLVMTYAPSSIEIIEPDHIRMDSGEAQGILNSIAEMLHKFAAAGIGGVMIGT